MTVIEHWRSESRLLWITRRAPFASRRARLRGFWHYIVRNHRYEICVRCGRPVGPHTGSWWAAPDDLWARVIGDPHRVVCPPCFTAAADAVGIAVCWKATEDQGGGEHVELVAMVPVAELDQLREAGEHVVSALLELLPLEGSWDAGYRIAPVVQTEVRALPEEWGTAAYAVARLQRLITGGMET